MKEPRFAELVRVSSAGQAARESPEDQRRDLDRLRRARPGVLVERIDSVVSGASDDRADLARLFALLAAGKLDELRVRHIDRITRHPDPRQRAAILGALLDAGAVVVEASGRVIDPADEMGELDLTLQGWMASRERRRIVERTMAAKRRLAAAGRLVSSTPPWGRAWNRERGWSLTAAAKDYRRLFELACAGHSLWTIARRLTDEGIASAKGRPWTAQMVRNLLHARHASGRWRSHGAEAPIPAIVPAGVQADALRRLAAHDHAGGRHATHPALLRKVLRCGVCGTPCHTNRNTGGELYYHCAARSPACYRAHNAAAVDDAVRARLGAWLRQRGALAVAEGQETGSDEIGLQRAATAAEKALRALDAEEERIGRLGARGGMSERTAAKLLREVAGRRAAAEADLATARTAIASAERRAELASDLAARIEEIRRGVASGGFAEWREAVEILFPGEGGYHVAIWPDGRLRLHAAVPLDAAGEEALRQGRGKRAPPSRSPCRIPVVLVARMG